MRFFYISFFLFATFNASLAQLKIVGVVVDKETQKPLSNAALAVGEIAVVSGTDGGFQVSTDNVDTLSINCRFLGYESWERSVYVGDRNEIKLRIELARVSKSLKGVEVSAESDDSREKVSVTKIDPEAASALTSAFGDFSKVLVTLPGVTSTNELSSTYTVRGGNFDENLVYVNDILIYRPFLVKAGRQEGLSFVNTDLVSSSQFSSGGWEPRYGDKLSSSLSVQYKKPTEFGGSATLGLLGGAVNIEGATKNDRITYVLGIRRKQSQYLLNSLETQGQYLPKFTDLQSYINFDLNKAEKGKTELGVLLSFANNQYLTLPENRTSTFGTFNRQMRLFVAFEGRDVLEYSTLQGGLKLSHKFNDKVHTSFILGGFRTMERERLDVEGGYRLCDVDNNISSNTFNECVITRGIGSFYNFSRNRLSANIINLDNRTKVFLNENNTLEFGLGYSNENIEDELSEYSFADSAQFVTVELNSVIDNKIDLNSNRFRGYLQNTSDLVDGKHTFTYGLRFNYWNINDELIVSPRFQYAFKTNWLRDIVFRAAIGSYAQPPFYRELRDRAGNINKEVKAQKSWHFISGIDYDLKLWGRDFKLLTEVFYKTISDVNPYDIDNVRIRYFAENTAKAFAYGLDFRINGEFIKGAESWFSLGFLNTKEDLVGDDKAFIRRPTDQRINASVFFQDHMPNDPTLRVSLTYLYSSGLPFGPPNAPQFRSALNGRSYSRADIGFSKLINFNQDGRAKIGLKTLSIGLEVLNLFGVANTISYTWITDVNNQQFAIPNVLSARFANIKLRAKF